MGPGEEIAAETLVSTDTNKYYTNFILAHVSSLRHQLACLHQIYSMNFFDYFAMSDTILDGSLTDGQPRVSAVTKLRMHIGKLARFIYFQFCPSRGCCQEIETMGQSAQ